MNKEIAKIVTMPNTKNKTEYATTIPVPRSLLRTEVMANKTGENKVKNLPIMFAKKIKAVRLVKPLNHITNDSGKTRHFTPAAQEWHNSIYNYNPNYIKALPLADLAMIKLVKGYFSSELKSSSNPHEDQDQANQKDLPHVPKRIKRMSTKKILVGKGEVKHSNDKAIVTFYIHNAEKLFLDRAIALLSRALYNPSRPLTKYTQINKNKQEKIIYNRILSFKEFWQLIAKNHYYKKWCSKQFVLNLDLRNLVLKNLNDIYLVLKNMVTLNLITEESKNKTFMKLCEKITPILPNPQYEEVMSVYEEYYVARLNDLKIKKILNRNKFRNGFIDKLLFLLEKVYGKKVLVNIVKQKVLHLNSDLYTSTVALKLKNRNNRLYHVLNSSLNKVHISAFHRATEIFHYLNKKDLLVNIIRNDKVTSMLKNNVYDPLSTLLLDTFRDAQNIKVKLNKELGQEPNNLRTISLQKYVFKSLKHLTMRGIRIEAKGRASRRLTAARSVFKMKWKGGLKNVDSSFKGLSAILLRGHFKSNVQHTYIATKNRNGAIGVKGWVSSR